MLDLVKKFVPSGVKRRLKSDLENHFQVPRADWSLDNMRRLGLNPKWLVDIGAFKGEWTVDGLKTFPQARALMLEANEDRRPDLEALKAAHPGRADFRIALLGPEDKQGVIFNEYPNVPTGNSVLSDWRGSNVKKTARHQQRLDDIAREAGATESLLIKLDVQGYELEVLKGAEDCLKRTEAILMEVSLIDMYQGNPLLHEVVAFMFQRGFVAYDISCLMRRPLDGAMVQIDLIFVPEKSPLRQRKEYGRGDSI